jgi:hypothetical protein
MTSKLELVVVQFRFPDASQRTGEPGVDGTYNAVSVGSYTRTSAEPEYLFPKK